MFDWILTFVLETVPLWVWIIVIGVVLGWVWKTFGWQGVVGGLVAVLTLGAYRQGWRDKAGGKPPVVPPDPPYRPPPAPQPRPRRNVWSLRDILRGRND